MSFLVVSTHFVVLNHTERISSYSTKKRKKRPEKPKDCCMFPKALDCEQSLFCSKIRVKKEAEHESRARRARRETSRGHVSGYEISSLRADVYYFLCCTRERLYPGGGGYSPKIPIRVCAAQRGRDFGTPYLERGIHFRDVS